MPYLVLLHLKGRPLTQLDEFHRTLGMKLILASTSPYRKVILSRVGLSFTALAPQVNEEALKKTGPQKAQELCLYLAEKKAESLSAQYPNDVVLGSDQMAVLDGVKIDKPGTMEKAFAQLKTLSGQEHELLTAMAVYYKGQCAKEISVNKIRLRQLSDQDIQASLEKDQPMDCAGSYKIEKSGLWLIESLKTEDPSSIEGLSVITLYRLLEKLKINPSVFWSEK